MAQKKEIEPPNLVRSYAIFNEQIRKEMRFHRLSHSFAFNPFSRQHRITGKVGSRHDTEHGSADEQFMKGFQRSSLEPVKKYPFPQTEAQEIGWITQPLITVDRTDYRLFHPRLSCSITRLKEDELKRTGKQS